MRKSVFPGIIFIALVYAIGSSTGGFNSISIFGYLLGAAGMSLGYLIGRWE